ncbi:MAG: hypothetical protein JWN45_2374 [Acidobacteriaceae bacterium]|nr:hypothetical protein [Acidobacteriaceae bacterium]
MLAFLPFNSGFRLIPKCPRSRQILLRTMETFSPIPPPKLQR